MHVDATPPPHQRTVRLTAEAFGSFVLVLSVVGAALFAGGLAATTPNTAPSPLTTLVVSLAAAGAAAAGWYAFGPLSGGHLNPVVTLGAAAAGRLSWREVPAYVIAQTVGALIATTLLFLVGLFGPEGWLEAQRTAGFASNGFGTASPAGFSLGAAVIVEMLFGAILVLVYLGATHPSRGTVLGGLAVGIAFGLAHLVSVPIDSASVNPARSMATALYGNLDSLAQLWVFLVFPALGALLAGWAYRGLFESADASGSGSAT